MTKAELEQEFRNRFRTYPDHVFFCPGRVNLIGEHIDYNGGSVMPCAIMAGTYLAVAKNKELKLRFQCLNFPETTELALQSFYTKTGKEWFNYPLGIIHHLFQEGYSASGLDMLFYGDLPIGAGLSSSASVEVVTAYALTQIFGWSFSGEQLALLAKKAENEFIGVNCGIMDQFAVAMGKKDHALLLNCDTLEHEYLPFDTSRYELVIINTNKPRSLTESKYNERFAECMMALERLQQKLDIRYLCEAGPASFENYRYLLNDPVLEKRAGHVIYENARVQDAVIALQTRDMETFGKLMYASHQSLKEGYEVSGAELDTIVDFCREYKNCIGARMTGAGFGGCAIALVAAGKLPDFAGKLNVYYSQKIGYAPGIFATSAQNGVHELIS